MSTWKNTHDSTTDDQLNIEQMQTISSTSTQIRIDGNIEQDTIIVEPSKPESVLSYHSMKTELQRRQFVALLN